MKRVLAFTEQTYGLYDKKNYENILRKHVSNAILLSMYHRNTILLKINHTYHTMHPYICAIKPIVDKDGVPRLHNFDTCDKCKEQKITLKTYEYYVNADKDGIIRTLLCRYTNQLVMFSMELRFYKIYTGKDTDKELIERQNVNYTLAMLLSDKLKQRLTRHPKYEDISRKFGIYMYNYLSTRCFSHSFVFDMDTKVNLHLMYLEDYMSKDYARLIRSTMMFKTNIKLEYYTIISDGSMLIQILNKPVNDPDFRNITRNVINEKNNIFEKIEM